MGANEKPPPTSRGREKLREVPEAGKRFIPSLLLSGSADFFFSLLGAFGLLPFPPNMDPVGVAAVIPAAEATPSPAWPQTKVRGVGQEGCVTRGFPKPGLVVGNSRKRERTAVFNA